MTLFSSMLLTGSLYSFNGALASSEKINYEEISAEIRLGNGVVKNLKVSTNILQSHHLSSKQKD